MQRILITGASRGIGRAIAETLSGPDVTLMLHGRDKNALEETRKIVEHAGAKAELLICDLTSQEQLAAMLTEVEKIGVDVLINNAAIGLAYPLEQISATDWNQTLAVNVTAPFLICQRLVPGMKTGSSIVNILSGAARTGFAGWTSYCMSKFALDGFTRALREELRSRGIRVINIYPGATDTDIWEQVPGEWPREKMMQPKSVAMAVKSTLAQPGDVLVEEVILGKISGRL